MIKRHLCGAIADKPYERYELTRGRNEEANQTRLHSSRSTLACIFGRCGDLRSPARTHQASLMQAFRPIPGVSHAKYDRVAAWIFPKWWCQTTTCERTCSLRSVVSVNELEQQDRKAGCERSIGDRDKIEPTRNLDAVVVDLPKLNSRVTGKYSVQRSWGLATAGSPQAPDRPPIGNRPATNAFFVLTSLFVSAAR